MHSCWSIYPLVWQPTQLGPRHSLQEEKEKYIHVLFSSMLSLLKKTKKTQSVNYLVFGLTVCESTALHIWECLQADLAGFL